MTRKNDDDLLVNMMVDLMRFPRSLNAPICRVGERMKNFDKYLGEQENDFKEFCKELEDEFKNVNKFHIVRTDIIEKDNKVVIKAEMPGFKKEDISINIEKEFLVISAETKEEVESEGRYITREIRTGKFQKAFDLEGFDKNSITAKYEDGILHIELIKIEEKEDEIKKIVIM